MAAIRHTAFLPFWSIPYVNSAVRRGYHPVPSKLPPDGNDIPPLQRQPHDFARPFIQFLASIFSQSNILCEKARNALRCKAFQIYARKSQKFELVVDTEKRLVYTVIRLKLESFRKVCYFAKTFCHFLDRKKDAFRRPFLRYSLEKAYPLHGSALVVHRRVDV